MFQMSSPDNKEIISAHDPFLKEFIIPKELHLSISEETIVTVPDGMVGFELLGRFTLEWRRVESMVGVVHPRGYLVGVEAAAALDQRDGSRGEGHQRTKLWKRIRGGRAGRVPAWCYSRERRILPYRISRLFHSSVHPHRFTYQPTYLPTYQPTHQPTSSVSSPPIGGPKWLLTHSYLLILTPPTATLTHHHAAIARARR